MNVLNVPGFLLRRLPPMRSTLPAMATSAWNARNVCTPLVMASVPWPLTNTDGPSAYIRAAAMMVSAGTPEIAAARSGG